MGLPHRSATAGVLLVALLLTGGPQAATAGEPDARGGIAARVPGKGSDLVAAGASWWWRAPADRRDPQAPRQPRQPRQLQLGTAATLAVLGSVLAWLAALPAPRRARPLRPLAPSGARSPPAPRLA